MLLGLRLRNFSLRGFDDEEVFLDFSSFNVKYTFVYFNTVGQII